MLDNITYKRLKTIVLSLTISLFFSCEEEVNLAFSEINILEEKDAVVEINIPKAEGDDAICSSINSILGAYTNNALNIDSGNNVKGTFEETIAQFNSSYLKFRNQMNEEQQLELTPWEAGVDGEVTYQSNRVISIAMNTYLNTGGIHGTSKVSFLNFDASTGNQIQYNEFIKDKNELKKFLKLYFEKEVESISFDDFKLPETIGLNEEGVIILYNANEIPSYTDNLTEFIVPFDEIEHFLKTY
ncbi:MAG: DUF4163 domain-containing protein [Flavobacteriaceae bacterium]|nr:DUF4163 domain-containing protein [Bacteroidia bacterium]NNL15678.1 DUF4163 domain-containing protein [Flavobacteriaceae bacterium]